jgi:hypothetical protein
MPFPLHLSKTKTKYCVCKEKRLHVRKRASGNARNAMIVLDMSASQVVSGSFGLCTKLLRKKTADHLCVRDDPHLVKGNSCHQF